MSSTQVKNFESNVATLFGNENGVMVNSGSSANLLAIQSLKLPIGSEIITPCLTFSTTVAPIIHSGLVPVFVDIKPQTFCIDEEKIESKITNKTSAIMVPNLFGNIPDWEQIRQIAERHGLMTIQDSADTLGARLEDYPVGRYSHISTTSFYASHVVTAAGFGGMLTTDSEQVTNNARLLRGWGRQSSLMDETEDYDYRFDFSLDGISYDAKYVFNELGYNFLPSEISAAFGLVQLRKLEENSRKRDFNFSYLIEALSVHLDLFDLPQRQTNSKSPWLAFPFLVRDAAPFTRGDLQRFLEGNGVQTRTVFTGNILRQPAMRGKKYIGEKGEFPHSDHVMKNGLVIGCHHGLSEHEIEHLVNVINVFIQNI